MTIITLFIILAISVLILCFGEYLVTLAVIGASLFISFLASLYLFVWACSASREPQEGFVKCGLPFLLAALFAVLATAIVAYLIKKIVWLTLFVLGFSGGAIGMLVLRDVILAGAPHLATNPNFDFYWLALFASAALCGVLAVWFKTAILVPVTCALGGYGVGVALLGLIPAFGGDYTPGWLFFIVFVASAGVGVLVQVFVVRKCCGRSKDKGAKSDSLLGK